MPPYSARTSTIYFIWEAVVHIDASLNCKASSTGRKKKKNQTYILSTSCCTTFSCKSTTRAYVTKTCNCIKYLPQIILHKCSVVGRNSLCWLNCIHKQKIHLPQITCLFPFWQAAIRDKLYICISNYLKQHPYYLENIIWMNFMSQYLTYFSQCRLDS